MAPLTICVRVSRLGFRWSSATSPIARQHRKHRNIVPQSRMITTISTAISSPKKISLHGNIRNTIPRYRYFIKIRKFDPPLPRLQVFLFFNLPLPPPKVLSCLKLFEWLVLTWLHVRKSECAEWSSVWTVDFRWQMELFEMTGPCHKQMMKSVQKVPDESNRKLVDVSSWMNNFTRT